MATPYPMCPTCSRPILHDASNGKAHLKCLDALGSVNTWPEGIRHLLCLKCGRAFESDSKALRLCKACRSGSDWRT